MGPKQLLPSILFLLCMVIYITSHYSGLSKPGINVGSFHQSYQTPQVGLHGAGPAEGYVGQGTNEGLSELSKGEKKNKKLLRRKATAKKGRSASKELQAAPVGEQAGEASLPAQVLAPKSYPEDCRWTFEKEKGGYPLVAFEGDMGAYVCPSTFRDLSDYVFGWPYSHFGENVHVMDNNQVPQHLPPVPIIYSHSDHVRKGDLPTWLRQVLKRPYVLITGQSDWAIPSSCSDNANQVLGDPNLVHWFAQNSDGAHPKLSPVPIGLNCFEHAPEMDEALRILRDRPAEKQDRVLVNFGPSHPDRQKVWEHFCSPADASSRFATCLTKAKPNDIRGNPHLVQFYQDFASVRYVLCPRGNGWDTHRVWEALYLGVIPVLLHSPIDKVYEGLPVLYVERYEDVTPELLDDEYERLVLERDEWDRRQLSRSHWLGVIEAVRAQALMDRNVSEVTPRKRCWGA